jgi:hypothetical protein
MAIQVTNERSRPPDESAASHLFSLNSGGLIARVKLAFS